MQKNHIFNQHSKVNEKKICVDTQTTNPTFFAKFN